MAKDTEKMEDRQEEKESEGRESYEWVQALVCSVLAVVVLFTFGARLIGVDGHSMLPTLQNGDRMLVLNAMLYHDYQYGDVVVLRKDTFLKEPIVKRVIATAGQTVRFDDAAGVVLVDGRPVDDTKFGLENGRTYLPYGSPDRMEFPQTVPPGCVFVLGDNRPVSEDSRFRAVGMVDERHILGRAVFRLSPAESFGPVT